MSQDDNFKRASLRGRGWKILRGVEQPTDEFSDDSAQTQTNPVNLTADEIDELLEVSPALGMVQAEVGEGLEGFTVTNDDTLMTVPIPELQSELPTLPEIPEETWPINNNFSDYYKQDLLSDFEEFVDADTPADPLDPTMLFQEIAQAEVADIETDSEIGVDDDLDFAELLGSDDDDFGRDLSRLNLADLDGRGATSIDPITPQLLNAHAWNLEDLDGRQDDTVPAYSADLDFPDAQMLSAELDYLDSEIASIENNQTDYVQDETTHLLPSYYHADATTQYWERDELELTDDAFHDELEELPSDLPIIETPDEEGLPIPESSVSPVNLSGELRHIDTAVKRLIPLEPEHLEDDIVQVEALVDRLETTDYPQSELDIAVHISEGIEGVVAAAKEALTEFPTAVEGIPLVEDIDRPVSIDLKGFSRMNQVRDLIPKSAETSLNAAKVDFVVEDSQGGGGILLDTASAAIGNSFSKKSATTEENYDPLGGFIQRPSADKLFHKTQQADPQLLERFVDDYRLDELWNLLDSLQEDVTNAVSANRSKTDTYQQELLRASDLLLQSRENYDDARAIAYRIRSDLRRDQQVEKDIREARWMTIYFVGWGIGLVVLWMLRRVPVTFADRLDVPYVGAGYLPAVAGGLGGLFLAYSTFHKHTAIRRDFDPIHMPWYFLAPIVGGLMGFLTYLLWLASVVPLDTSQISSITDAPVLVILLAFGAGVQQNWIIKRLRILRESWNEDEKSSPQSGD